jgi:hypothetical protein
MLLYSHRINSISKLEETNCENGVEFDIRSNGEDLYLHHDAFGKGELFSDWLNHFDHAGMIVNTKCEGMEEKIIGMLHNKHIENYFLLDMSLPFMVKWMKKGFTKMAVRHSKYEPIEYTMKFAGCAEWVWVDCFDGEAADRKILEELKRHFKVCIVSPELQGYPIDLIEVFKDKWKNIELDGVCTKHPENWN